MRAVTKRQRGWPLNGESEARLVGNRGGCRVAGDTFPGDLGEANSLASQSVTAMTASIISPFPAVRRTEPKTNVTELPAPADDADVNRPGFRSAFSFWRIELCRTLTRPSFVNVLFGCSPKHVAITGWILLRQVIRLGGSGMMGS